MSSSPKDADPKKHHRKPGSSRTRPRSRSHARPRSSSHAHAHARPTSARHSRSKKKRPLQHGQRRHIGKYTLGDVIGRGAFGIVYKAVDSETGQFIAVKAIRTDRCSFDQIESLQQEISLLQYLRHPCIVEYLGHKQTRRKMYIFMEFVENGSLLQRVRGYEPMGENLASQYTDQILEGLAFLHSEGIIHRDIKGANLLMGTNQRIKLADFGVAAKLGKLGEGGVSPVSGGSGDSGSGKGQGQGEGHGGGVPDDDVAGTPYWMAPEIIEMMPLTTAVDIWSVGATVIELLTGYPPYFDRPVASALYRIVQDKHPPLPETSSLCRNFLLRCFQRDPQLRPKAAQLRNHPWIRKNRTLKELELEDSEGGGGVAEEEEAGQERSHPASEEEMAAGGVVCDSLVPGDLEGGQVVEVEDVSGGHDRPHLLKVRKDKMSALLMTLTQDSLQETILQSCTELLELLQEDSRMKQRLFKHHGVLRIMNMLHMKNAEVVRSILEVLNAVSNDSSKLLETLCLMGVIPIVMKFTKRIYTVGIRRQASIFFCNVCHASHLTRQMFIACRGWKVLVQFLIHEDEHFSVESDIMFRAIDCILLVISESLLPRTAKNDYFRVLSKARLPYYLQKLMKNALDDSHVEEAEEEEEGEDSLGQEPDHESYLSRVRSSLDKMATLTLLFSESDEVVKVRMSEVEILRIFFSNLHLLPCEAILKMLQALKNLALNHSSSDKVEEAGGIEALVHFLGADEESHVKEVLTALYSLCRLNPDRSRRAVQSGMIPYLQTVIRNVNPLRDLAVELLCSTVVAGKVALDELWKNDGVDFFISLMELGMEVTKPMQVFRKWMRFDQRRLEAQLSTNENIARLVVCFDHMGHSDFCSLVDPLYKIVIASKKICRALGSSGKFLRVLKDSLVGDVGDAYFRMTQLKLIRALYRRSRHPKRMVHLLNPVIQNIAATGRMKLAVEIAQQLVAAFQVHIQL